MVPDPGDPAYLGAAYATSYDPRGPQGPRHHFTIPTAGAYAVLVETSPASPTAPPAAPAAVRPTATFPSWRSSPAPEPTRRRAAGAP
ncbi:hypothetical protein GCM10029963_79510 [Micromonospora andamanensis]